MDAPTGEALDTPRTELRRLMAVSDDASQREASRQILDTMDAEPGLAVDIAQALLDGDIDRLDSGPDGAGGTDRGHP